MGLIFLKYTVKHTCVKVNECHISHFSKAKTYYTHFIPHNPIHTHWHTFCTKVMISIQKCACTDEWNKVCVINTAFWVPTYQLPNHCPSYLSFKCSGLELHEWAFVCCKDQKRAQYIQSGICDLGGPCSAVLSIKLVGIGVHS